MKITFIGTGSIIPDPKGQNKTFRSYSAVFVELKNKETFLFDVGPGTLTKLQLSGIDTRLHPDHLAITHYHIDHCLDYVALIKNRWFDPKTGAILPGKKLNVYGPTDLHSWTEDLCIRTKRWSYMYSQLPFDQVTTLNELKDSDEVKTKNWTLRCAPVEHFDGIAYRLEAEGKSFVYSGDMMYDEHLANLGEHADVVAVECSFPSRKALLGKHLCPEDIGRLAKLGNFNHVVLTHMYPLCAGKEQEMKQVIASETTCQVTIAEDFFTMTL